MKHLRTQNIDEVEINLRGGLTIAHWGGCLMNKSVSVAACGLGLLLLLVGLSGCGGGQTGLVDAGKIHLESHAQGKVYVAWSDAHEEEGGFVVTGVLRRQDTVGPPIKATVEVEIVSPCGSILDQAQSDHLYVPHRKVNKVQGFERFRVRFPKMPPEGSSVRIVART
jgi:hypothetical protein